MTPAEITQLAHDVSMLNQLLTWDIVSSRYLAKTGADATAVIKLQTTDPMTPTLFLPASVIESSLKVHLAEVIARLTNSGVDLDATIQRYLQVAGPIQESGTDRQERKKPLDTGDELR